MEICGVFIAESSSTLLLPFTVSGGVLHSQVLTCNIFENSERIQVGLRCIYILLKVELCGLLMLRRCS